MKIHLQTFIVNWAKEKHFFAERDEAGNVLIRKPATVGMENRTCCIASPLGYGASG